MTTMKRNILILILFSLLLHAKTFTTIKFQGDVDLIAGEFDRDTLLKICHIEYPPIYKPWKSDPIFEENQIDGFVKNLITYAKSMGYYRVKVFKKTKDDTIILNIQKYEPIKIVSIELDPEFERFSLLQKGHRFRTTDFTQTKKRITRYLEEYGYPTYTMNAKAEVDLDLYQVKIKIDIDKGEKRFFGKTDLNNSSKIDQELIAKQIVYEENELYNVLKLEESYDNIYRLGVFSRIKIQAEFNQSQEGITPIDIQLEEGKTKELISRLGYDTQDGARGAIDYIDHNFFGNLREFKIGAKVSQRGYRLYTGFFDPTILDLPLLGRLNFRNEVDYHDWEFDGYDEALLIERATLGLELFRLDHYFGFQLEENKISSDNPLLLSGSYLINSLFYKIVVDERDNPMDAKNGYYLSFYAEKAMREIGSDIDYLKLLAEGRYIKAFDPWVWAIKARIGDLSKPTPLFKHFFAGGAMSNRGYEYRDVGIHVDGDAIGGVSMIDASLESRYYLSENFSLVTFIDASTLSQDIDDFSQEWYPSYGLGMRYLSIIGPLRFDIGFQEDRDFAIHLGIGQVF
jgi:translocation and assembly module TamA